MATYNGGSVIAHIGADASDYFKAMSAVGSVTGKTMGSASSATQGATGKFSLMNTAVGKIAVGVGAVALVSKGIGVLKDSVGSAVARFDTLNQYPKVMKQMGYSTQDTNKSVGILKKGVDGLPTSLQDLTKSAQSFAILTGSATEGAKSATALNDAFLASGASAGDASRGVQQYTQMLSSGKVDLQSWKTLQETMPYALTKVAKSFGLTGKSAEMDLYKKLQSGEITVDQLNDRFVKLDGGVNGFAKTARTATGGIGTSFTNMRNAVTNGLANMLTSIDNGLKQAGTGGIAAIFDNGKKVIINSFKAINSAIQIAIPVIVGVFKQIAPIIKSAFDDVINSVKGVINFIKNNYDWLSPLAAGVAAGVGAFKLISGAIKAYQGVIKIALGVQKAFNTVMAINPFVLTIVAIAAVVGALVWFFTQTKTGKKIWSDFTGWLGNVWNGLVDIVSSVGQTIVDGWNATVDGVKNVWNGIGDFFSGVWNGIVNGITGAWNGVASFFSNLWNGIVQSLQPVFGAISQGWQNMVTNLSGIWNGIVDIAKGIWNLLKDVIMGPILLVLDLVTGDFTQLGIDAQNIWNNIVSSLSGIWNGIVSIVSGVWDNISRTINTVWDLISSTAKSAWSAIVSFLTGLWNGIVNTANSFANNVVNGVKNAWNALPGFASSLWNGVKNVTSNVWSGIYNGTYNMAVALVRGVRGAWSGITGWASGVWNGVKSVIRGAMNFDLWGAGQAIMNSFFNGLISAWGKVKSFVGGIASWIREHKGPISYDRKLLIPAGAAIMGGFGSSLSANFADVKKSVSSYAGQIADEFGQQKYVASAQLTANSTGVAGQINGGLASLSDEVAEQSAQEPVFLINNDLVGDKIVTTVNSKNARRQATTRLVTGGI